MAEGDLTIFNGSLEDMIENWSSTDILKCAVLDPTTAPTQADVTPALGDYTEVGTAGNYVAGGQSLGTVADFVSFLLKVTTLDSAVNPFWAQNALNDTDARWFLVYNDTIVGKPAFCFVDMGGNKNMATGDTGVTWASLGLATLTLP